MRQSTSFAADEISVMHQLLTGARMRRSDLTPLTRSKAYASVAKKIQAMRDRQTMHEAQAGHERAEERA